MHFMHFALIIVQTYSTLILCDTSSASFNQPPYSNAHGGNQSSESFISTSAADKPSGDPETFGRPEPKSYTVIPLQPGRVAYIEYLIDRYAVAGSIKPVSSPNVPEYNYVLYWSFKATESNSKEIKARLGIDAHISEDVAAYEDPEEGLPNDEPSIELAQEFNMTETQTPAVDVRQRGAAPDLKVVSQAPGQALADVRNYEYSVAWTVSPTIYIIDRGVDTTYQQDFGLGIDRWLYSEAVKAAGNNTPTDPRPDSHGSCVLSKAIGLVNGVYKNKIGAFNKNSKIVVYKMAQTLLAKEILEAWDGVYGDIRANRAQPAVVIFSILSTDTDPAKHARMKSRMSDIFNLGGTIVVPSGNHRSPIRPDVDAFPALWESPDFPLIVVGAVDNTGTRTVFSQGPSHVTVYAPGSRVRCAKKHGYRIPYGGTSFSNGMVGGLAAYVLARRQIPYTQDSMTPTRVKNYLQHPGSWVRSPAAGLPVIWNGEEG